MEHYILPSVFIFLAILSVGFGLIAYDLKEQLAKGKEGRRKLLLDISFYATFLVLLLIIPLYLESDYPKLPGYLMIIYLTIGIALMYVYQVYPKSLLKSVKNRRGGLAAASFMYHAIKWPLWLKEVVKDDKINNGK